jgi:DnaJ-class molecular chaperone
MIGFADIDCPWCRGLGDQVVRRDRSCKEQSARRLRCRRCRGTGVI